jgi:hypothetical protein
LLLSRFYHKFLESLTAAGSGGELLATPGGTANAK